MKTEIRIIYRAHKEARVCLLCVSVSGLSVSVHSARLQRLGSVYEAYEASTSTSVR